MEDDEAVDSKSTDLIGLFDCQFDVRRTFAEAGTLDVFAECSTSQYWNSVVLRI